MSVIIRLQNLPWSASASDIRQFFRGLSIPEGGVHIVGGDHGDAFIAFSSDEDARQAMALNGERLQDASVRLLLSSRAEMQRVIEQTRSGHPVATIPPKPTPTPSTPVPSMPMPNMGGMGPLPMANPLLGMPLDPAGLLSALQNPQLAATYAALFQAAAFAQTAALKQEKPAANAATMSNESLAAFGFAPTASGAPQPQQQQRISPMIATPNAQPLLPQAPPNKPVLIKPEVEVLSGPKSSIGRERKTVEEKVKLEEEEERDRYRYGPKSKSSPDRDKKRSRSKERRERRRWDRSRSRDRRTRSRSRERRHRRTSPAQRKRDLDEFGRDKRRESYEKDVKHRDNTYRKETIPAPIPSSFAPKQETNVPPREQEKPQPLLKQAPKDRAPQKDGPAMPLNEKGSMVRETKSRFSPLEPQVLYVDKNAKLRESKHRFSPLEQEVPDLAKIPSPKVPLLSLNLATSEFQPFPQNGSDSQKTWAQAEKKENETKVTQASPIIRVFGRFPRLTYKAIRSFFRGIYIKADNIRLLSALDGQLASIAYVRFDSISDKVKALNTPLDDTVILRDASSKEFDQAIDDYQPNKFHREMLYDSCFCVRNLPNDATADSLKVALSGFDILDVSVELVTSNYPNCLIGYVRFSTLQEAEKARELLYSGVLFDDKVVPVALAPVEEYFKSKLRDTARPIIDETKPKGPISETTFVKGLPPTVTERDILDFFSDAGVFPVRIHFLLDSSNNPSGDAIIEFQNPEDAEKATAKNGSMMGLNTIEVSTITRKKAATFVPQIADSIGDVDMEVEETEPSDENEEIVVAAKEEIEENPPVVKGPKESIIEPQHQPERSLLGSRGPLHPSFRPRPSLLGIYPRQPGPGFQGGPRGQEPRMRPSLLSNSRPFRPIDPRGLEPRPLFQADQFIDAKPPNFTDPRSVVCLQNIPYKAGIEDVLLFFDEFGLRKEQIARKFSDDGFPTDEARVFFDSPSDVGRALRLNGRKIWNRPIRVSPLK